MADRSLRATLALWMIPASACILASSLWLTQSAVARLADSAYDRSLEGALRAIEADISVKGGGVGIELPYALLASLQATAAGVVYVRVTTEDGLVQIGDVRLPPPPRVAEGDRRFYDARYHDMRIRVGALRTRLPPPPHQARPGQTVLIEVAETTESREAFLNRIARVALWRDAAALLLALAVLILGAAAALRPLNHLREQFARRRPDDLSPLPLEGLPTEARPLVETFNALMHRHAAQAAARKRFLDDASHQLRTPIGILRMQIDVALSSADPEERRAALEAMRPVVERTARTTSQLLALARAGTLEEGRARPATDLRDLAREVAMLHLPAARRRRIALDLDLPPEPLVLNADPLLHEALSNLLDNAIRVSPDGGAVVLTVRKEGTESVIEVVDDGPGMAADMLDRLGQRFLEGSTGMGLGLALAMTVARMHGGRFEAANRTPGFRAALILPSPAAPPDRKPSSSGF